MSAVAMACWPRQMLVTNFDSRSHLTEVGAIDGSDVQHVDLCALAQHALALLHATGRVEHTDVQLELPDEPVFARVNRRRMEQVMLHLIVDAVGAHRRAETTTRAVRLSVEPQDDFGDYGPILQMRYSEPSVAEQEPGHTSENAPQESLTVARELVEALGAHFTVRKYGLSGTTVTVSVELPDQGTASW